ncbi:MAG: 16S rRNA (guanine(966)-N(2))-methyltransferase RsmD [Rhodospirillaceae bacterium]
MRIVGGKYRGKKLRAPEGRDLRPTSDRARQAIFNILAHGKAAYDLDGIRVIDLFCGTGAMGLEAISRGAAGGVFIDRDPAALKLVKENAASMGVWRDCLVLGLDGTKLPPPPRAAHAPVDIAFIDPPYGEGLAEPALLALQGKGWLKPGGLAVVEVGAAEDLAVPPAYETSDERTYGAAKVYFLKRFK